MIPKEYPKDSQMGEHREKLFHHGLVSSSQSFQRLFFDF